MKVIVGLGNPGTRYALTRHNVGFQVVRMLSDRWSIPIRSTLCRSKVGEGLVGASAVRLTLPQTMMNVSGEAVQCLISRWKLEATSFLIVCDDVSLPLGTVRVRASGSDGGHKGLASIIDSVQSREIPRLRVGIRSAVIQEDLTAYVLGRFRSSEKKSLEEGFAKAVEACDVWVKKGLTAAMNLFNRRVECQV